MNEKERYREKKKKKKKRSLSSMREFPLRFLTVTIISLEPFFLVID
jgi:hypothetical protein